MIQNFKDHQALLYHYTSIRVATDYIIKTGKLRMGSFRKTNDPKESKNWEFNLGTNQNRDLGKYRMTELSRRLSDTIKDKARLLCFCRDAGPLSGNHMEDVYKRGFSKARMWAQYGEKHTGVCLVFDQQKLEARIRHVSESAILAHAGPVTYRNRSVVWGGEGDYMINVDELEKRGFGNYWPAHIDTYRHRLFFEKLEDWRDENEFRYIAVFDHADDVFIEYGDALVGIVFGDAVDESVEDALIQMLLPSKVQMMGLKWKNCSPWYDFGNFKYDRQMRKSPWYAAQLSAKRREMAGNES